MLDFSLESLGVPRPATTWVAFENSQPPPVKPKRRKGTRGRATPAEMAAMLESGAKVGRRGEQQLRPEQVEALRLKREPRDHSVSCLAQEDGEGNVEYKYRIKDPHPVRLQQLITQMKFRLSEGNGECFYYIGVEDNGYPKGLEAPELDSSIRTLHTMAASLTAAVSLRAQLPAAWGRRAALLRVATRTAAEAAHTDLRVAVAGAADAGKSTLVAVLTTGADGRPALDNGRGLARMNVFRHKHEMQSGRTSSICHCMLGYDREGRVINYATPAASALTPAEISGCALKVLTLLDLGGHEKYLKTALYGLTALLPDFALLAVCAGAGPGRMGVEHLAVAVALEVPVAVVVTKIETVRPERFAAVVSEVRQLVALTLAHEGPQGAAQGAGEERRVEDASPLVTTEAEALASARVLCAMHADSLASPTARGSLRVHTPIFAVSAVTGAGLPLLHAFLNALQPAAALKGAGAGAAAAAAAAAAAGAGAEFGSTGGEDGSSGGGGGEGYGSSSACTSAGASPRAYGAAAPPQLAAGALGALGGGLAAPCLLAGSGSGGGGLQQLLYAPAAPSASTLSGSASPAPSAHASESLGEAEGPGSAAAAVHFQVDGSFEVEGVGSVVSGTLVSGTVRVGQRLAHGPTPSGEFGVVVVSQLQRSHVPVQRVLAGQTCTMAICPAGGEQEAATAANWPGGGGYGGAEGSLGFDFGDGAGGGLPLGSSPGVGLLGGAAGGVAGGGGAAQPGGGGGGGGEFGDALEAAAAALDLCLASGDSEDEGGVGGAGSGSGGGGGDDYLFAFAFDGDSSPGASPGRGAAATPPPSASGGAATSAAAFVGGGGNSAMPLSVSVSHLHSTTSFCAGGGGGGAGAAGAALCMSSSAPTLTLSGGARLAALATSPAAVHAVPYSRKGCVLLEPALRPRACWTFEAVLILLGGHWPARGLLSGRWPPAPDDEEAEAAAEQLAGEAEAAPGEQAAESGQQQRRPKPRRTGAGGAAAMVAVAAMVSASSEGVAGSSDPLTSERSAGSLTAGEGREGEGDHMEVGTVTTGTPLAAVAVPIPAARATKGGGAAEVGGCRQQAGDGGGKAARRRRQRSGAGAGSHLTVVHCGSVRQPAHVLMVQELFEDSPDAAAADHSRATTAATTTSGAVPELTISASTRAAAALLHSVQSPTRQQQHQQPDAGAAGPAAGSNTCDAAAPGPGPHPDLGCLVRVLLRWQHRPEWLREGAKLLVRDRCDGRMAGAGFVRRVIM